jgi:hypothetical protein
LHIFGWCWRKAPPPLPIESWIFRFFPCIKETQIWLACFRLEPLIYVPALPPSTVVSSPTHRYGSKKGYGSFRCSPAVWNEWVTYKRFDPGLLRMYTRVA